MDIAEKIAAEIDAIPGQPTSYEVARVAIEAYQREMWTPHFDLSRKFNLLPELRRNRASQLTAHIMNLIGKYICEHDDEHDLHRRASGDLFEAIYESGCDIITDADRKAAGLPDRGPYGMTRDEMQIMEAKRTEAMLRPPAAGFRAGSVVERQLRSAMSDKPEEDDENTEVEMSLENRLKVAFSCIGAAMVIMEIQIVLLFLMRH